MMQHHRLSATCCGESLKNPILPIVYLLIPSGHQVDTRKPKRNMAQAERCPIYIHIKTKTFIYIGVLVCLYLGTFTYLFTLIILYFWYIVWLHFVSRRVVYASAGVHLSGRYTINGGHFGKTLPVLRRIPPQPKENYDHHED